MIREAWEDDAACAQMPGDMFFPEKGDWKIARDAKTVCNTSCPVREQCLEFALREGFTDGIFGGFNARQRNLLLKKRSAA